jgi:glutathione S-transferase
VLRDEGRDRIIPESSIIIEYLQQHYPGKTRFVPEDAELARQMRFQDRFYDLHMNVPMQKVVTDRLRPAGKNDSYGVEQAKSQLQIAIGMVDRSMAAKTWALGDDFTMADCAAAPALFFANKVMPFGKAYPNAAAYLTRLMQRPSFARAVKEAEPYLTLVPKETV